MILCTVTLAVAVKDPVGSVAVAVMTTVAGEGTAEGAV
jgi:hypothetical protein